jgi:outer membrane cobalamin receptor
LTAHLDWQDARDRGASPVYYDQQLTYHSPLAAQLRCDLAIGAWQVAHAMRFRAGSYWARSNLPDFKTPDQWSHSLLVRHRLAGEGLTLAVRIENLFDADLEDVRGYPLPGRAWYAEIEWRASEPA